MRKYLEFIKLCKRESDVILKRSYVTYYLIMVIGIFLIGTAFLPSEKWWYLDYSISFGLFMCFYGISALNHEYLHAYAHHLNGGFTGYINILPNKCYCLNKREHSYTYKQMRLVLMLPFYVNLLLSVVIMMSNLVINCLIHTSSNSLEQWNPVYSILFSLVPMLLLATCSLVDYILLRQSKELSSEFPYLQETGDFMEGKGTPKFEIIGKH